MKRGMLIRVCGLEVGDGQLMKLIYDGIKRVNTSDIKFIYGKTGAWNIVTTMSKLSIMMRN